MLEMLAAWINPVSGPQQQHNISAQVHSASSSVRAGVRPSIHPSSPPVADPLHSSIRCMYHASGHWKTLPVAKCRLAVDIPQFETVVLDSSGQTPRMQPESWIQQSVHRIAAELAPKGSAWAISWKSTRLGSWASNYRSVSGWPDECIRPRIDDSLFASLPSTPRED